MAPRALLLVVKLCCLLVVEADFCDASHDVCPQDLDGSNDFLSLLQVSQQISAPGKGGGHLPRKHILEVMEHLMAADPQNDVELSTDQPQVSTVHLAVKDLVNRVPGDTDLYWRSPGATNAIALGMVCFAACAIFAGYRHSSKESHFPAWVVATLIVSYSMWFFGFFLTNSKSLMVMRSKFGQPLPITGNWKDGVFSPGPFESSPWSIIHNLTVSLIPAEYWTGVIFATFAVGDPILKLVLIILANFWRYQESTIRRARSCLLIVRVITKWASPVFFVAILMHSAVLSMDTGSLVGAKGVLDIGWVGYMLFCITNIVSATSIGLPQVSDDSPKRSSWTVALFGRGGSTSLVLIAALCYLYFLGVALFSNSFSFALNFGSAEEALKSTADPEALTILTGRSMSIWQCLAMLAHRAATTWQVTPFLASVVLLIFVGILPVVDICALTAVSLYTHSQDLQKARRALGISRVVRHALMTDVVAITLLLMGNTGMLALHNGVHSMFMAECIRYTVTYGVVESACLPGIAAEIDEDDVAQPVKEFLT